MLEVVVTCALAGCLVALHDVTGWEPIGAVQRAFAATSSIRITAGDRLVLCFVDLMPRAWVEAYEHRRIRRELERELRALHRGR